MAKYWAREEEVEAIQYNADDKGLDSLIAWALDQYDEGYNVWVEGHTVGHTNRDGWKWIIEAGRSDERGQRPENMVVVNDRDYLVVNGLGEFHVMSETDFTKRYYRRGL